MEKENIILNNIRQINEIADYIPTEEKVEETGDKKAQAAGKKPPAPAKDAGKPVTDAVILKYFTDHETQKNVGYYIFENLSIEILENSLRMGTICNKTNENTISK